MNLYGCMTDCQRIERLLSAQLVPFSGVTQPKIDYQVNRMIHQKLDSSCKYGLMHVVLALVIIQSNLDGIA